MAAGDADAVRVEATRRARRTRRRGTPTFADALAAARAGRSDGFTALYRGLDRQLAGFARSRSARDVDAVVNETFLRVFRRLDTFEGDEAAFRSWVFTICRNLLIDESRRERRRPVCGADVGELEAAPGPDDVEGEVDRRIGVDDSMRLLAALTDDQRDVVTLRVLADLSIREVAGLLDKPEGAVKSLQHRGFEALAREISRSPVSIQGERSL